MPAPVVYESSGNQHHHTETGALQRKCPGVIKSEFDAAVTGSGYSAAVTVIAIASV